MSVANGTYFIYARRQGKYLQFTDGLPGTKLTIWQFTGDADQQWVIAQTPAGNSSTYTVQNNRYKTYAATSTVQSDGGTYVIGGQQPSHWFMTGALDGYIFSPTPAFDTSWNVEYGYSDDGTPIIFYPLQCDLDFQFSHLELYVYHSVRTQFYIPHILCCLCFDLCIYQLPRA